MHHLGLCTNMLHIWSACEATVLVVMVVGMAVYTKHISNHLGNNLSEEFLGPRSRAPLCQRGRRQVFLKVKERILKRPNVKDPTSSNAVSNSLESFDLSVFKDATSVSSARHEQDASKCFK